jgi:(4S)-4-hydroxy-5-phosphonooxypentane-2,3-dione isomerase
MIATTVMVHVKPEFISRFIQASIKNHEASVKEPGNVRFDVLQSSDDPSTFLLYEAYDSEEAKEAHKTTAHYRQWKETVADWMQKPRESTGYIFIRPEDGKK